MASIVEWNENQNSCLALPRAAFITTKGKSEMTLTIVKIELISDLKKYEKISASLYCSKFTQGTPKEEFG